MALRIKSLELKGFRAFKDLRLEMGQLQVAVGANGSGKTSLVEFLRFLRDGMDREIPPEIIPGTMGSRQFYVNGSEMFEWKLEAGDDESAPLFYEAALKGPEGFPAVISEEVYCEKENPYLFMENATKIGLSLPNSLQAKIRTDSTLFLLKKDDIISLKNLRSLALGKVSNYFYLELIALKGFISNWLFYDSSKISLEKIRRPGILESKPILSEDGGNLSTVLHYLMTEHEEAFEKIQLFLGLSISGFERLRVKASGGRGQVMAFWKEKGLGEELTLADLSEGTLRLLYLLTICAYPYSSALLIIEEPEVGLHPKALPILAGCLKNLAEKNQVFTTTHSSYFMRQFELENLVVFLKDSGEVSCVKPNNSKALIEYLDEFGLDEVERIHISEEFQLWR